MRLLTPEYGLLFWTTLTLLSIVLSVTASFRILRNNNNLGRTETLGWLMAVFFIPFIGAITYFTKNRSGRNNK
jgi:hypothetical protein